MKGPTYFTEEASRSTHHRGQEWYERLFSECVNAQAIGEVSPFYMTSKDAPELIYGTIPKVKLLFVLRNPIDRLYSYYRYSLQRGFRLPSLEQMIAENHPEYTQAVFVSSYQLHLKRYLDVFPREQIIVFIYEDWVENPQTFLSAMFETIGVDASFESPLLSKRYNPSQRPRYVLFQNTLNSLGETLIKFDLPKPIFNLMKRIRQTLWQLNSEKIEGGNVLSQKKRRDLQTTFAETVDYVEHYLRRTIPTWHQPKKKQ
jgi:hypothetical protein